MSYVTRARARGTSGWWIVWALPLAHVVLTTLAVLTALALD
jgi:uncharacterized membrane protein YhaH (DUF805 family)